MAEFPGVAGPADCRVGARITARRELLGLSEVALAARLGCSVGAVQGYESGRVRAGAATLMLLTRILGVDVGYFLRSLIDDTPPPTEAQSAALGKAAP